jgi:hypothetical protein
LAILHRICSGNISVRRGGAIECFAEAVLIRNAGSLETRCIHIRNVVTDDLKAFAKGFDGGDATIKGV